ncbi:MAG: hypothetical protein JW720_13680 [Sedimentisphaerales bacterium]|nr:hypothetical protein [Sedimentisphaerales bacterium]
MKDRFATDSRSRLIAAGLAAMLVAAVGCSKKGAESPSGYEGSWAQVADIVKEIKLPVFPEKDFNIKDYGAVGDGATDCKEAIDKAVLACCYAEGGRVVVPAGTYLVNGPIHFQSDTNLHLEDGAKIVFGTKFEDYLPPALTRFAGTRIYNYSPMIYAYRKKNVAITGSGVLDAQGSASWSRWAGKGVEAEKEVRRMNLEGVAGVDRMFGEGHYLRPGMIQFLGCENVLVEGVRIVGTPASCVHPVFSRNVTLRNAEIDSKDIEGDGVVVDSCENVHISGVRIAAGGHAVALKSGWGPEGREMARATRNVYIHNCEFDSKGAFAIGAEIAGGVYNIFAEKCKSAVQILSGFWIGSGGEGSGEVSHIRCRDMEFADISEDMLGIVCDSAGAAARFGDVRCENIKASGSCQMVALIAGRADMPVENIVVRNVTIGKGDTGRKIAHARDVVVQGVCRAGEVPDSNAADLPPDVYAGADRVIDPDSGKAVVLHGVVADDGPATSLKYEWSVVKGEKENVKFSDSRAAKTEASFSKPGIYMLRLTADDGKLRGSHMLRVRVGDEAEE